MRPRTILLLTGFFTTVISLLALFKSEGSPSILGGVVADKIDALPSSPALYLVFLLLIGIFSVVIAVVERKIVY